MHVYYTHTVDGDSDVVAKVFFTLCTRLTYFVNYVVIRDEISQSCAESKKHFSDNVRISINCMCVIHMHSLSSLFFTFVHSLSDCSDIPGQGRYRVGLFDGVFFCVVLGNVLYTSRFFR